MITAARQSANINDFALVATTAHLHEAVISTEVDDELIDHTGRLVRIMADCAGMGMTLEHYPPAPAVLAAHAAHLAQQSPTANRYVDAAIIADYLTAKPPNRMLARKVSAPTTHTMRSSRPSAAPDCLRRTSEGSGVRSAPRPAWSR